MAAACIDMVNKYEPLLMQLITATPPQQVCNHCVCAASQHPASTTRL
jgi:hypothetical protein